MPAFSARPAATSPPDRHVQVWAWGASQVGKQRPRFPLKGSLKGDIDVGRDIDVGMDIDSNVAVSINWESFKGSHRALLKGFGVNRKKVLN